MIKTNLLPPDLQKQKKAARSSGGPASSSGGGGGALFALLLLLMLILFGGIVAGSAYYMYTEYSAASAAAAKMKKQAEEKKTQYEEQYALYREQLSEYNEMKSKEEILDVLMPEDRLMWTAKLGMLVKLVPEEVFITDIRVTENIEMVQTAASKRAISEWEEKKEQAENQSVGAGDDLGRKPEVVKKPIITHTMEISAITPYDDATKMHSRRVVTFREAMQEYSEQAPDGEMLYFRDHFKLNEGGQVNIDTPKQERKSVDGQDVWAFTLGLMTMPIVEKEANEQDGE